MAASLWWQALGHRSGCAHYPAGAPNAGASAPLWSTKGEGGGGSGLTAGQTSIKGDRIKSLVAPGLKLCTGSFGSGFDSKPFCRCKKGNGRGDGCLQVEDSRHGNRLGRDRTGRSGQGPDSPGRRRRRGRGLGWTGLGCDLRPRLLLLLLLWARPPFQSVSPSTFPHRCPSVYTDSTVLPVHPSSLWSTNYLPTWAGR